MDTKDISTPEELNRATMATLTREAATPEAKGFHEAVMAVLEDYEAATSARKRRRTRAAQARFQKALEGFLGDLLRGARTTLGGWVYRSRYAKSFSNGEVAYRPFIAVMRGMEALDLIEVVGGYNAMKTVKWDGSSASIYQMGKAARYRATPILLNLASRSGVEVKDASRHFQESKPRELIVLKDSSRRIGKDKLRGRPMPFARTPHVEALEARVRCINEFLEGIDIQGGTHRGFYRGFNLGDRPDFNWNKGGRLYSIGEDSYQRLKQRDRLKMTLNGEPVAEIDIRASYLSIFHGKLDQPLEVPGDLYDVPGFPREVVKGWLVATFGNNGHLKRWPQKQAEAFKEETGQSLSQAYPISSVRAAMLAKYPLLNQWGQVNIDWGDLMFAESEAVIGSMIHLITVFQIPSLPVHDSLLVPVSAIDHCIHSLTTSYMVHCKIRPQLKVNEPDYEWTLAI